MTITFHHPPITSPIINPLVDFQPWNQEHYPETKGIYINGLRLNINNKLKFVPIYVGIACKDTLKNRLFHYHYKKYQTCGKGCGNSRKDIWDFNPVTSLNDLFGIYSEMFYYDCFNNYQKGVIRTSEGFLRALLSLKYLLFYQNRNYFEMKSGGVFQNLNEAEREMTHCDAIAEGFDANTKLQKIKAVYAKDFYYVFCPIEEIQMQLHKEENKQLGIRLADSQTQLKRIERVVKRALNTIGIHTTAKSEGEILDMNIDLTKIQNELVNLGGHPYNSNGTYNKLIISIRK